MDEKRPLEDEAAKRAEWRGDKGGTAPPDTGGHSLPASEDEDERLKEGDGYDDDVGPLTIAPPPD